MEKGTNRLIPVTKWPLYHPWPTVSGLRHLIFFSEQNGLNFAIRRIGRRVLIDEHSFFLWANRVGTNSDTHQHPRLSSTYQTSHKK